MESLYYYLGGNALHSGLYVDLIERLEDRGLIITLVARLRVSLNVVASWRAWQGRGAIGPNPIDSLRSRLGGGVELLPIWSPLPTLSAPWLMRILSRAGGRRKRAVLHTRQIVMARLALSLKRWWPNVRVIAEMEGDDLAELEYRRSRKSHPSWLMRCRWQLERLYYFRQQRAILRHSDAVICVSEKLRDALLRRHPLPPDQAKKLVVFPTLASKQEFRFDTGRRARSRSAMGLDDRFVVIYSGNLRGEWQVPDKLVDAFQMIRSCRPDAFFLVLTPERDGRYIEPHLARSNLSPHDWRLHAARHAEVSEHLCGADVGLLLRDRHPMNEVAAPGKFAEYALSGLPIVMTDGIGDFSAPMRDSPYACVIADLKDTSAMREGITAFCRRDFTTGERTSFAGWAAERFATESTVARLADLYRTV